MLPDDNYSFISHQRGSLDFEIFTNDLSFKGDYEIEVKGVLNNTVNFEATMKIELKLEGEEQ